MGRVRIIVRQNWRIGFTILYPIIMLWLPLTWYRISDIQTKAPLGAYVLFLMAGFYMTECLPLPITSFIPVILYPLFNIQDSGWVASNYLKDSNLFLLGGCMIALAFEYSNLHMRIALKTICLVGSRTSQLLFGIMTVSMILSMWMNNTSTTAMMIPICLAIANEIKLIMIQDAKNPNSGAVSGEGSSDDELTKEERARAKVESWMDKKEKTGDKDPDAESILTEEQLNKIEKKSNNLKILFLLGTAYAAGLGGIGLITGTASNLVAQDILNKAIASQNPYKNREKCVRILDIDFLTWAYFNLLPMLVLTYVTWFFLLSYYEGLPGWIKCWKKKIPELEKEKKHMEKSLMMTIKRKYKALGKMTLHEKLVITFFVITVILWITRSPKIIPGWADGLVSWLGYGKGGMYWLGANFRISDATSTLLVCIIMMFVPRKPKHYREWRSGGIGRGMSKPVMSWDYLMKKIPWGVFILLGGGSALADGTKRSGLNDWIGQYLGSDDSFLANLAPAAVLLISLILAGLLTAVASNVACASIVVPVFLELSFRQGLHPYYLVLSATTVCSYAFILPVSTPPNALVYDAGKMKTTDMLLPGLVVTAYAVFFEWFFTHFIAMYIWNFNDYQANKGYCNLNITQ